MTNTLSVRRANRALLTLTVALTIALFTLNAPTEAFGSSHVVTDQTRTAGSHPSSARTPAEFRASVARLTNHARDQHDRSALHRAPCLDRVAQHWAERMARTGHLVHNDWTDVQEACGRSFGGGENIASGYASPRDVVRAWMHSDGHRANILSSGYDAIGIGAARDADGHWWWVQDFADLR